MNREELVEEIKSLANSQNIEQMKMRSNIVRNAFRALTDDLRNKAKENFLKEGGLEEDFKFEDDNLDIEFNKYYSLYREKRQHYIDEQERIKRLKFRGVSDERIEQIIKFQKSMLFFPKSKRNFEKLVLRNG
jgi:hypothetical protein